MKKKQIPILIFIFVMVTVWMFSDQGIQVMQHLLQGGKSCVVAIDAGHGGFDPGKVGINGELEKDINLKIAIQLQKILKKHKIKCEMTRTEDVGLYEETESNKKINDLRRRIEKIQNCRAQFAISIHQNSFEQESSKGAQVFYHTGSLEGKELAASIQEQLRQLQPQNHREIKANDSYYMLKKTSCPLVIVECGFLSNREEAEQLRQASYQKKLAEAIAAGILQQIGKNEG